MKKFITILLLGLLFVGCDKNEVEAPHMSNVTVLFSVKGTPITRSASINDSWPTTAVKTQAEYVVNKIYTTPKNAGISFFTSNYTVKLTNDKGGSITSWTGSTALSLTETNTITVQLTPNNVGAYPKFKEAAGTIDVSQVDLDASTINVASAKSTGDISIVSITNNSGQINVVIQVNLTYDSYLLVAPSANFSILSNTKGFNSISWGSTAFNNTTDSNGTEWFYYWGDNEGYVQGKGAILTYGFNLSTTDNTKILVNNGYWYGLFASWSSVGEESFITGIQATAKDLTCGGAIR